MPPVMFSVVTKYHKGRHSLFLYNLEIFCAFTQDILRSQAFRLNKVATTVREFFLVDERTKNLSYFVCSSMVLEKRGTISEEENRLFFSSFCMTKRKIFCPFYFYKMGRWRLRKANRHNPKGIKGESETSPFSSHIVIQERSALYYNVIACSIYGFIWSILL